MVDIKQLTMQYFEMDENVKWKGLEIKPILVKDWYKFLSIKFILEIEKNKTNDIEVIQMSYLDFLYKKIILKEGGLPLEEQIGSISLLRIMDMCLGLDYKHWEWAFDKKGKMKIIANGEFGKVEINGKDFDDFRRIVMYQNFSDYDDEFISDDVKEAMAEYNSLANKGIDFPSFEKQIACVQTNGFTKKEITEMTYRSFKLLLDTIDNKLSYQIMKTAEMSGTTFKNGGVSHWIYSNKKDKFEGAFASQEKLENSIK